MLSWRIRLVKVLHLRLWLAKSPFLRHLNGMGRAPYNPPKAPSVPGVLKCIISQCQILLYYFHFYLILHSGDIEDFKVYIAYKLHTNYIEFTYIFVQYDEI